MNPNIAEQVANNRCSAGTAYEALAAFARATEFVLPPAYAQVHQADAGQLSGALIDLLTNLRHFCHAHGLDYAEHDAQAAAYFAQEVAAVSPMEANSGPQHG
jgi:hypothetical protein